MWYHQFRLNARCSWWFDGSLPDAHTDFFRFLFRGSESTGQGRGSCSRPGAHTQVIAIDGKASSFFTHLVGRIHSRLIFDRRRNVLARRLAALLPSGSRLLDVGCGDGSLGALLGSLVPGLHVEGVEVHARPDCAVPFQLFDGQHLPFPDNSFDLCLFVDVLHHSPAPVVILQDACRVSRKFVLVKDHLSESHFDYWTLRLMDWVGNAPHGVSLPYNYLSRAQWDEAFRQSSLVSRSTQTDLPLYPPPLSWLFGRGLHFISLLEKKDG